VHVGGDCSGRYTNGVGKEADSAFFLKIYTSGDISKQLVKGSIQVKRPALSILGWTQIPDGFAWLQSDPQASGLVARFSVVVPSCLRLKFEVRPANIIVFGIQ
jgi:hypothetical protein